MPIDLDKVKEALGEGAKLVVVQDDPSRAPDRQVLARLAATLSEPTPLVRAPDFHPRRRLQIRGAIAAASLIAPGDPSAATPRIAQMIKATAAKQRPHKVTTKKRRKDRKRQRQARKKNR